MDKDYEYEYELPDFDNGRITYPGSGYVSPYKSEHKAHHERTTKPQPPQKTEEEEVNEAMRELIAIRNKSTVTAAVTIKKRYDSKHPKKPMTEEKALEMAITWWDKKNPEFSYTEYPNTKIAAPTLANAERSKF